MSDFLKHWFEGFNQGLQKLSMPEKTSLMRACARACSHSYSLQVYQKIRREAKDISDFFEKLKTEIPEIQVCKIVEGKKYDICYKACLCDLYTKGYLTSDVLCQCSQMSLLYNLETVFPQKKISICLSESILRGDPKCVFRVTIE